MKILVATVSIWLSVLPAMAENKPVEKIGEWVLEEDIDPLFGPISYAVMLPSSSDSGASELSVLCTFESNDPKVYTWGFRLKSTLVSFDASSGGIVATSLFKLDQEEVFEVKWLGVGEADEAAFASNNVFQDNDSEKFKAAYSSAARSTDPADLPLQSMEAFVSGLSRLLWNLQNRETLALGFTVGGERKSIVFTLADSRAAFGKLFARCEGVEPATGAPVAPDKEELQKRAHELASWSKTKVARGNFSRLEGLSESECVEVRSLKRIKQDPVVLFIESPDGSSRRIEFFEDSAILSGPISVLDIQFGNDSSPGEFAIRTWHNQGIECLGAK